jgi:hypothetical protein
MDDEIKRFDKNYGVWFGGDVADEDIASKISEIHEKKKHLAASGNYNFQKDKLTFMVFVFCYGNI